MWQLIASLMVINNTSLKTTNLDHDKFDKVMNAYFALMVYQFF